MTRAYYTSASETAEGRKNLHNELLNEMQARIDAFIANAPAANQAKVKTMMDMVMAKAQNIGNGDLFNYFCEDGISDRNFILYCQDVLKGVIC